MEPVKKILRTPSALVLLLVAIVSLTGVIIKSETDKDIARIPIDATSTAEARLTQLAIVAKPTITPTLAVNITATPMINSICEAAQITSPQGAETQDTAGNFPSVSNSIEIKWNPPECIMNVNFYNINLSEFHREKKSGTTYDISKAESGILRIEIYTLGVSYKSADIIYVHVEN